MTYKDLKSALDIFQLGKRANLKQIKARHRELVKRHHPDRQASKETEAIRQANEAFETLSAYCENYQFSFTEEEFLEQNPEERLRQQFGWDPMWSGSKEQQS
jgi:DnaJ-class molecular chaperone